MKSIRLPNPSLASWFGGKPEPKAGPRKTVLSVGAALEAAYRAGRQAGDTGAFANWWKRANVARSDFLRSRLEREFERGVNGPPLDVKKSSISKSRGYAVWEAAPGDWRTDLERESSFESKGDVLEFLRAQSKNPCGDSWKKGKVTDRALRYRANSKACRPAGPARCLYCGSRTNPVVHHLDGREKNVTPENLAWACKACNTSLGVVYRRARVGRVTRQYNPGATSAAQWVAAVMSVCPRVRGRLSKVCDRSGSLMPVAQAVQLIRDTPAARRSEFARAIWSRRHGSGRTGRREKVPF
jgi:5-methylcytosine-specific restriction endonuclease McrA